ncbi:HNH endonuclease [Brevundimonas lutea]|uniref:HNH endonuclease n=1 Tax=Brevundimonas lutea TaxID=2293980 RepID=UPI000F036B5D|nr:HNH endonuclease signature motif containing protein [Brevundimonas lutea]
MVCRWRLAEAQNWRCAYCSAVMTSEPGGPTEATRDHVVPRSVGGDDSSQNLVAACFSCNVVKADLDAWGFARARMRAVRARRWLPGQWPSLETCVRIRSDVQEDELDYLLNAWRARRGVPSPTKGDRRAMREQAERLGIVFHEPAASEGAEC